MELIIRIDLENDAFDICQNQEIADMLTKLARNFENDNVPMYLADTNGNYVGYVEYKEGE